jgi:hypothetical protein
VRDGSSLWRATRQSPWWYCSHLDCRFDLPEPAGTCYLGTDELCGVLESIGTELGNGVVSSEFLDARRLYRWRLPRALRLANLVSRRAVGFGVNNELSAVTPYDLPQQWAAALYAAGFEGIRYRTRFDTGASARGIAHFGNSGVAARPPGTGRPIGQELRDRLRKECGIRVVPPPELGDLEIAPDPC